MLTKTTEPIVARQEEPNAAALKEAQGKPLGEQTFQLVSVTPFKPESHKGEKVEARGSLSRSDRRARQSHVAASGGAELQLDIW